MKTFKEIVAETVKNLKNGKTILYPTDTIWGLGCDATNAKAIEKIYKIKQRPESKSLIVLLDSFDRLRDYVKVIPPFTQELIESVENPLSIIYPGAKNIAKNIIPENGSVCIRITSNKFCQEIIRQLGKPITSTSANISGEKSPLIFEQVSETIKQEVDYIVELEQDVLHKVKASTIIKIEIDGSYKIIRP
ncbi:MAG: threonylcarbamoyl-AMP synthase [Lentimicrobiaceae bacterium]|jgi:L-threonylcarbamoyladenylate synthase|nr:threonylcarbamoyl-AMP synthase [Lentimicrobiaceae bacterium]